MLFVGMLGLLVAEAAEAAETAKEWAQTFTLDLTASTSVTFDDLPQSLQGHELVVEISRDHAGPDTEHWVGLMLGTQDDRWYRCSKEVRIGRERHQARFDMTLDAANWGGEDGPLQSDALHNPRRLYLDVFGPRTGSISGTVRLIPKLVSQDLEVLPVYPGLVNRGPWLEWQFRLLGDQPSEIWVIASKQRIPAFLHQPGQIVDGRWRARGPEVWVARFTPEEASAITTLGVVQGPEQSPLVMGIQPGPTRSLPLSKGLSRFPMPKGHVSGSGTKSFTVYNADRSLRIFEHKPRKILAPILSWRASWTGFRGPRHISHAHASYLDEILAEGTIEGIDLLPQNLLEEQGTFRYGLMPWAENWTHPQDLFNNTEVLQEMGSHALELVARCRATPGLTSWRLGLTEPTGIEAQRSTLTAFTNDLAQKISERSHLPIKISHQALTPFTYTDDVPWQDFESLSSAPWQILVPSGAALKTSNTHASSGEKSLQIDFPSGSVANAAFWRPIEDNIFNLDRLDVDVLLRGDGHASLYLFVTDRHHRFYQQEIAWLPADDHWRTLSIPFDASGNWTPLGHSLPLSKATLRRVRRIGFLAVFHNNSDLPAHLNIDRIRRLGWAAGAEPTTATITDVRSPSRAERFGRFEVSFMAQPEVQNPYNTDHADVWGEAEGPNGEVIRHPAFWLEPFQLSLDDGGKEQARPAGQGGWRWRFSFPTGGEWRWRLHGRFSTMGQTVETTTPWQTVTVDQSDTLPTIRQSSDPRYWETVDGQWFYPLGINFRSPGDALQNPLMDDYGSARSIDYEKAGTDTYERLFTRMGKAKLNYARVWMSPWWCGIEWSKGWDEFGGLTDYNQAAAARLDRIVDLARTHRIYLQLELNNHGMLSQSVDQQWDKEPDQPGNPYNRSNGGPVRTPAAFFESDEAWNIYAKRLRYTVARWGAESHLMAWVCTSEMEFTGAWWRDAYRNSHNGHSVATQKWVQRHLDWFAQQDYTKRPVSIHFSHPWRGKQIWRMKGLGFSNSNVYSGFQQAHRELGGPSAGLATAFKIYLEELFPPVELNRPTMVGEWGGHWQERNPGKLDAELRVGLWLQTVLPYGGNTGFWWWLWVDVSDNWKSYTPIATFLEGEDPRGVGYEAYRPKVRRDLNTQAKAYLFGSRSPTAHRYYAWIAGLDRTLEKSDERPAGMAIIETNQPGSTWRIQRHAGDTGKEIDSIHLTADSRGNLQLPLGVLSPDAVFKVDRLGAHKPNQALENRSREREATEETPAQSQPAP